MGFGLPGSGTPGPIAWGFTFTRPDPLDSVVEFTAVGTGVRIA